MRVEFSAQPPRRIGIADAGPGLRALELGKESMPGFENWVILYDEDARGRVSQRTLERQDNNTQFLTRAHGGDMWWRRIVPSSRRGFFHLESLHKATVYDVDVDWVCEILGLKPPGQDLPPFDE